MNAKKIRVFFLALIIFITAGLIEFFNDGLILNFFPFKQIHEELENKIQSSEKMIESFQKVHLFYTQKTKGEKDLFYNAQKAYELSRLHVNLCNVELEDVEVALKMANNQDVVIIATEFFPYSENKNSLENFIRQGGNVKCFLRTNQDQFDDVFGIKKNRGFKDGDVGGIKFLKPFFPGLDEIEIKTEKAVHSIVDIDLENDVEVFAMAENIPIIFGRKVGSGSVLYVNSTFLMDKAYRGVLLQLTGVEMPYFLMTMQNAQVVDIDDFPAPIKRGKNPRVYKEYGMSNENFYRRIWWPDIYNLADKYDLKYSAFLIGTYGDDTRSPIEHLKNYEINDLLYFGREFLTKGWEMGLHGYNHNSIAFSGELRFEDYGYNPWESEVTVSEAMKHVQKMISQMYGDLKIYSYVPPSNIISKRGQIALKKALPDLKVIASIYTGSETGDGFYQEFGENKTISDVYDYPRFTSGYRYSDESMWDLYCGMALTGVMHHFVHPDDILSRDRAHGQKWSEMRKDFDRILKEVKQKFPMIRPMMLLEAVQNLKAIEDAEVFSYKINEHSIGISYKNSVFPMYHYFRTNGKISKVVGGRFWDIDPGAGIYVIESSKPDVVILLSEKENTEK